MKGFGTVVTGTLISGTIRREEELELFPSGRRVRVRGVQVHGRAGRSGPRRPTHRTESCRRDHEDLARGMSLAPPDTFTTTRNVDVAISSLLPRRVALKDRSRVHLPLQHDGNRGRTRLPAQKSSSRLARFRSVKLSQSALLLPGDRFIIRQFSPVITIGGGTVLDAAILARVSEPDTHRQILATGEAASVLKLRIQRRAHRGISLKHLVSETGWTSNSVEGRPALGRSSERSRAHR